MKFKMSGALVAVAMACTQTAAFAAISPDDDRVLPSADVAESTNKHMMKFFPAGANQLLPAEFQGDSASWLARANGLLASSPTSIQEALLKAVDSKDFSTHLRLMRAVDNMSLQERVDGFKGDSRKRGADTQKLNSSELVYKPIAQCRIYDSRNAALATGSRGPLGGNTAYNFKVFTATDFSQYGGSATTCGIPNTSSIDAIALVVNVLTAPFFSYLSVGDTNSAPTLLQTSSMQYGPSGSISSTVIARAFNNAEMYIAFPAGYSGQVTIDAVGYFISPTLPTATLDTVYVDGPVPPGIAANSSAFISGGTCAAGYTAINGEFDYNGGSLFIGETRRTTPTTQQWRWFVQTGASAVTFVSARTVCQQLQFTP